MLHRTLLILLIGCTLGVNVFSKVVYAQSDNARAIEDIRNAYEALDFAIAETRINDALRDYERFLPQELSRIHVFYALILFAQGNMPDAEPQLKLAVQLDPSLELDPLDTPPRLFEMFKGIKKSYVDNLTHISNEQDVRYVLVSDPRADAALRSMIVPGWGQLYKGEKRKGVILLSLWGLTASGSLVAHFSRNEAQRHYRASDTQAQTQSRFRAFSTWHKVRNNLVLAATGIWVYSYIDSMVWGKPIGLNQSDASPLKLTLIPLEGNTYFAVQWQF